MTFPDPLFPRLNLSYIPSRISRRVENLFGLPSTPPKLVTSVISKCPQSDEISLSEDDLVLLERELLNVLHARYGNDADSDLLQRFLMSLDGDVPEFFNDFCSDSVNQIRSFPRIIGGTTLFVNENVRNGLHFDDSPDIISLPFDNDAVKSMNRHIKDLTRGLIDNSVSQSDVTRHTPYLLTNTLTFMAHWKTSFKKISDQKFTLLDGSDVFSPSIFVNGRFEYCEDARFQYIAIPYAKCDCKFELLILNKFTAQSFNEMSAIGSSILIDLSDRATVTNVDLLMPEFELKSGPTDFGTHFVLPEGLKVTQVGVISVDEFGTKAAAATVIREKGVSLEEKHEMVVNSPFIFFIRGKRGEILFAGQVVNPIDS
jgi:hypothetical protein